MVYFFKGNYAFKEFLFEGLKFRGFLSTGINSGAY